MRRRLFLTSEIGGLAYQEQAICACPLREDNGLIGRLAEGWRTKARCLFISSDPEQMEMNRIRRDRYWQAFTMSGLPVARMDVCDRLTEETAGHLVDYDALLLAGGHVPTQNQFFHRLKLRERMQAYEGTIIGISAGTMNCADIVYAPPELEGEALDSAYQSYWEGLGLTWINILPHFEWAAEEKLDGLRLLEDVFLPDSCQRPFFALPDGSYIMTENDRAILYGEGYWIENGIVQKICENEACLQLC